MMSNNMYRNNNGYMNMNLDYMPLMNGNRAYIRVDGVSTGNFPVKSDATLIAKVGPRGSFMNHGKEFNAKGFPQSTWDFAYNNSAKSSFVLAIFKKRLFGGDEEIGEIELRLGAFEPNTVVSQTFDLQTPGNKFINVKARVSVHLSEDGSFGFCAPTDGKVISNAVIPHRQTYFN